MKQITSSQQKNKVLEVLNKNTKSQTENENETVTLTRPHSTSPLLIPHCIQLQTLGKKKTEPISVLTFKHQDHMVKSSKEVNHTSHKIILLHHI